MTGYRSPESIEQSESREIMPRFAGGIAALLFVFYATPLLAQGTNQNNASPSGTPPGILEGTPEEQAACAADVHKYCRDDIPDTFKVLACLKNERGKLGRSCQQVLINHGQ
jgi:hypothetical protein